MNQQREPDPASREGLARIEEQVSCRLTRRDARLPDWSSATRGWCCTATRTPITPSNWPSRPVLEVTSFPIRANEIEVS